MTKLPAISSMSLLQHAECGACSKREAKKKMNANVHYTRQCKNQTTRTSDQPYGGEIEEEGARCIQEKHDWADFHNSI